MKKIYLLVLSVLIIQCDDGDFDVPNFIFENNIGNCGDLIIYNIANSEALILNMDEDNNDNLFFKTEMENESFQLDNRISYRVFNGTVSSSYFCQDIPPTSPSIANEWNGSGTVIVTNTIVKDDKDTIEEMDLDLDTDNDGIPNYIDIDDDNDGILTKNEINADGSLLDTDNDTIPDYLDNDDDNDGILTINEFITDTNGDTIADYLDNTTTVTQVERESINNSYTLNYATVFKIENMSLVNDNDNTINYANFDYGTKTGDVLINN